MSAVLLDVELDGLRRASCGKVRDMFDVGDALLIVASDRISAFDVVLPTGIPDKGRVLTALSDFWFELLQKIVPHHRITSDVSKMPDAVRRHEDVLRGRTMLVKKAKVFPVECVARGYISGSGWKDYQKSGAICGIALPKSLRESDRLPEPIFTPATKAVTGHDENISFDLMVDAVGRPHAESLRKLTLDLYRTAAEFALSRGIILADTKFEFGLVGGAITLVDEVLTPDSSRFWPADRYTPGQAQPSFDKQFVRDYLESIKWNKQPPAPALPPDIVEKTRAKYRDAYARLVGRELPV